MGETSNYTAVTGDLVASRKLSPEVRAKVQAGTLTLLEELNGALQDALARPAVLTAGDEIQALFLASERVVEFVRVLRDRLESLAERELGVAIGVGHGPLSTGELSGASVEQLDGTCFHHAREALTRARKEKRWVVFLGFGTTNDSALNSLFELMGAIRNGWTSKQAAYIRDLRELDKRIEVARRNNVSPSVVTESLQVSNYEPVKSGEVSAAQILNTIDLGERANDK